MRQVYKRMVYLPLAIKREISRFNFVKDTHCVFFYCYIKMDKRTREKENDVTKKLVYKAVAGFSKSNTNLP